ncbi:MAG: riboflavin synthase [Planctomycetota bacterium]
MFTGIVQTAAPLAEVTETAAGRRLVVDVSGWVPEGGYVPKTGHSIAVDGVCLTVVAIDEAGGVDGGVGKLAFDAISETLDRTTLSRKRLGDRVHIEPAVLPTQPMGGHVVQGHVDGVGEIVAIQDDPADWRMTFAVPAADGPAGDLMAYLMPKGSITLDGVSLTLAEVDEAARTGTVALIPETLSVTTLGERAVGGALNVEVDALVKTVVETTRRVLGK